MTLTRKLLSIHAFYNNGGDDGFGMRFNSNTRPSVWEVDVALTVAFAPGPRTPPTMSPETMQVLLKHFAKVSKVGPLNEEQAMAAVLAIAALTKSGALVDDEYNGIVYAYDVAAVPGESGAVH